MTLMTLMLLTLLTCARSHPRPALAVGQHSEESNHDMSSVERRRRRARRTEIRTWVSC
jgi:hypothetical protein